MASAWRLLVSILALVSSYAGTTTDGAATFTYDVRTLARVDVDQMAGVEARSTLLSDAHGRFASLTGAVRGSSTTPRCSVVATKAADTGPDFVAGPIGSQPPVPVSQSRMAAGFDAAGFPSTPTASPGSSYTLPDGSKVRLMEPTVQAPRRASFTNADDGYINPFTGKPVQPPAPPGVSMKEWVRLNSHVEQTP
jgi:hypothetical protein